MPDLGEALFDEQQRHAELPGPPRSEPRRRRRGVVGDDDVGFETEETQAVLAGDSAIDNGVAAGPRDCACSRGSVFQVDTTAADSGYELRQVAKSCEAIR